MNRKHFFRLALFSCSILTSCGAFAAGNESYQRYMIFHNDYDRTVYPIVKVGEDDNCATKPKGKGYMRRLFVNYEGKGSGVPPKKSVKVLMPDHCWYNAGRVLVLDVPLEKYETLLHEGQRTVPWDGQPDKDICVSVDGKTKPHCFWGFAQQDYPIDTPMQLLEYTFDSDDPVTGEPPADKNFDQGIPQVDVDVSGVDSLYLPAAIAVDAPSSPYLGTIMEGSEFRKRVSAFIEESSLPKDKQVINWAAFSAYTKSNWENNLFRNLATPVLSQSYNVPGGEKFVALTTWASLSDLYKKNSGMTFMVDGTTSTSDSKKGSSDQVRKLYSRWKKWIDEDPCAAGEIDKITTWPAHVDGKFDKKDFCDAFRDTVRYVWAHRYPIYSKEANCIHREVDPNLCTMRGILGYELKEKEKEELHEPRSVQAMMRSVPHGHFSKKGLQYHLDKWLLFWAPYDSIFNLNPYTRLIHNEVDGIDAFAYSFSIDDKYGNYRNKGTGFIVDMGGSSALPLKRMYDPYHRYSLSSGTGRRWKKMDICGTVFEGTTVGSILMPESKNGNPPECEITIYADDKLFVKVLAVEMPKLVTDLYTGRKETVMGIELKNQPTYCYQKSSPELKQVCNDIKVTPRITDAPVTDPMKDDTVYINVATEELPGANIIFPDVPDFKGDFYWPNELEYSTEGGNWAWIDWSPAMVKGSSTGITYHVKINPLKPPMEIVHSNPSDLRAKIRQVSPDPKQEYGVEVVPVGDKVPAGSRKTVLFTLTQNLIWDRYRDVLADSITENSALAYWHVARTNRSADKDGISRKYKLILNSVDGSQKELVYDVQLDPGFLGTNTTYPLKNLLPDTEYNLVVQAVNPTFQGGDNDIRSEPFKFRTKSAKPVARIVWDHPNLTPVSGSVISGSSVKLTWNRATIENGEPSMLVSYAVKVNGVIKGSIPGGNQEEVLNYVLTGLTPNTQYNVEVEALSSALASPKPARTSFKTASDEKPTKPLVAPTITFKNAGIGRLNVHISAARGGKMPRNYQYRLIKVVNATTAGAVPRRINPGVIQVIRNPRSVGAVEIVVEVRNGDERAVARARW